MEKISQTYQFDIRDANILKGDRKTPNAFFMVSKHIEKDGYSFF